MGMNAEVASPFSDDRKIQIVWNSGADLFKKQLTTLGISCREDFKSQFKTCKEKFPIAEQHRTANEEKTAKPKTPSNHVDKTRGGGDKTKTKRYTGKCNICNKTGHKGVDCFQNPNSPNYRPMSQPGGGEPAKKRKFDSSNYNKDPKFKKMER